MNKPKATFMKFYRLLLGEDISIQHKVQNIILLLTTIGAAFSTIISAFLYENLLTNFFNLFCVVFTSVMLYISCAKKKMELASLLLVLIVDLIIFPVMYVSNGGFYSGMTIWYSMGLIFPWMLLKGKKRIVCFFIGLTAIICCVIFQYQYPEMITLPVNEKAMIFDIVQSIVSVSVTLSAIFTYQTAAYEKQRRIVSLQEEDLKQTMNELKKSDIAKSIYLAQMSHEIRTPINAVLGMDEMIIRETKDPDIEKYARNIQDAGQSLLSIINDILDFSKMESGNLDIIPVNYDLDELISYCRSLVELRANEKKLEFSVVTENSMPHLLFGDEVRIRQVLINLLTNAVKYTASGRVELRVSHTPVNGGEMLLKLEVADTGKGISEESIEHLFEIYRRFDEKNNRNIEGTGLGLAITKQLTALMGGTISVKSDIGHGSVFTVELPQKITAPETMAEFKASGRSTKPVSRSRYKEKFTAPDAHILVVDDVKMNVDVMKGLLKATGVRIDTAYSGRECLGLVKKNRYDVIFMDHLMPEMDGVQTLEAVKNLPEESNANRNTPVIALTANAMPGAYEEYISYGFSDYLSKPINADKLEDMLLSYLPEELILRSGTKQEPPVLPKNFAADNNGIPEIDFLDTASGLFYCCGSREAYMDLLRIFCGSISTERIAYCYSSGDWDNYLGGIQTIRNAAQSIGATELAAEAKLIENAVKKGSDGYLLENHSGFVSSVNELKSKIRNVL